MSGGDLESDMYVDVNDESESPDSSAPTEQSDVNNEVLKCTMIKQMDFEIGTYSLRARYLNDLFAHDQKFFPSMEYSSDQMKYKEELLEYEGILAKLKLKRDELGQCPISDCQIHRTSMAQPLPESPNRKAAVNQINKSAKTRPAMDENFERPSKRHSARATTATNSFHLATQNKFDNIPETIEEPTPPEIKIQPIMLAMTSNYNIALQNINKNFPGTNNETHLQPQDNFFLPNFHGYRNDRINPLQSKAAGGTAIFIKNHLPYHHVPTPPLQHIEASIISLNLPNLHPIIIASIYVPVNSDPHLFTIDIEAIMQLGANVIMCGDYNAHHMQWKCNNNNARGLQLLNFAIKTDLDIIAPNSPQDMVIILHLQ
ncbi:hypothetical protein CDAR_409371 [Caerostris darwini]|uniref:Endonuclease/exonuclease/phosphatase domain-containing protein n=2 Tax=Caerostris darwini TaxID=1538125 RepID=A0AAV4SPR3_9ARAC|nr:hypothetical protein CDAR_409371 [Caerostris darwini]